MLFFVIKGCKPHCLIVSSIENNLNLKKILQCNRIKGKIWINYTKKLTAKAVLKIIESEGIAIARINIRKMYEKISKLADNAKK